MTKDIHYLRCSVFCHPQSRAKLLTDGLRTFVERHPDLTCILNMNDYQGSNVKILIATTVKQFDAISQELHQHLQSFLDKNPSPPAEASGVLDLFANFPSNSIRYNLFHHVPFLIEYPNRVINIDLYMSRFWKELMALDEKVAENILENRVAFSHQLLLTLLFYFSSEGKQAHRVCDFVYHQLHVNNEVSVREDVDLDVEYPEYHRTDLESLTKHTWETLKSSRPTPIITPMKRIFKDLAKDASRLQTERQRYLVLYQTFKRISCDLGLRHQTMLTRLFKQTLEFMGMEQEVPQA